MPAVEAVLDQLVDPVLKGEKTLSLTSTFDMKKGDTVRT
jgi:hypothetical protein